MGLCFESWYCIPLQVCEGLVIGKVTHILWPLQRWQKVRHKLTAEQANRILINLNDIHDP